VWADSLLQLERTHALGLATWGAMSIVAGTALWFVVRRRERSEMLHHFSLQMIAWGALALALGGMEISTLGVRDHAGAVRLERRVWFKTGLFAGLTLTGVTLVVVGWTVGRRLKIVGAGVAVTVHGIALTALAATLGERIVR
jgi:hypothetical protein